MLSFKIQISYLHLSERKTLMYVGHYISKTKRKDIGKPHHGKSGTLNAGKQYNAIRLQKYEPTCFLRDR